MTVQPDSERAPDTSSGPSDSAGGPAESTLAWVGPFAVFMAWLAFDKYLPIANPAKELLRDGVLIAAIIGFSRRLVPTTTPYWMSRLTRTCRVRHVDCTRRVDSRMA
jgi:hypothetical protein